MGLRSIAQVYRELAEAGGNGHANLRPWVSLHRIDRSLGLLSAQVNRLRLGCEDTRREWETLRRRNSELEGLVNHDAQTGLPSRRVFDRDLEELLGTNGHATSRHVGLLLLGLDAGYGRIRQTLGYTVGDTLLYITAQRIQKAILTLPCRLYQSDRRDDFIIVLDDTGAAECESLAEELQAAVTVPHHFRGNNIRFGCSIGIAVYPEHGPNKEELLRNADTAMGESRARNRPSAVYESRMGDAALARMEMESELRRAIERGGEEFELHYQPIVDQHGRVLGSEALIRWRHPREGLVSPGAFIPLAEETGLILPIGHWVLYQASEQLKAWHDQGYGDQYISVNLSARQLEMPNVVDTVRQVLMSRGLDPRSLEIELTESSVMADPEAALAKIQALRGLGIGVAIDDFGTGYSSLTYLRRFPVDTLKIDRSFVKDLNTGEKSQLVDMIIGMAANMHLRPLAEGVETAAQRDTLVAGGCYTMQGYYFSRPVPAAAMGDILAAGGMLPLPQG
jgi:diguanylate cyclase (GGDEF)-like protein